MTSPSLGDWQVPRPRWGCHAPRKSPATALWPLTPSLRNRQQDRTTAENPEQDRTEAQFTFTHIIEYNTYDTEIHILFQCICKTMETHFQTIRKKHALLIQNYAMKSWNFDFNAVIMKYDFLILTQVKIMT